jgi:hypothetical protein
VIKGQNGESAVLEAEKLLTGALQGLWDGTLRACGQGAAHSLPVAASEETMEG